MEDAAIKQLWHEYDLKLEKSLRLNYRVIKEMQTQKYETSIGAFRRNQHWGIVGGIAWILFLVFLIVHTLHNIYFVTSVGSIALLNALAVATYIRHLVMLDRIDITSSITEAQSQLAAIQASLNNVGRILVLQGPFYCTFWYNQDLVDHGGSAFWTINLSVVCLFITVSIYLFNKLTGKNIHLTWVRGFLEGFGGKKLTKAIEFLSEIDDYKMENVSREHKQNNL